MIPYALIIDEFLPEEMFKDLQGFAFTTESWDMNQNPMDGINYPDVIVLDESMRELISIGLERVMGSKVQIKLLVLRRSMVGTPCPEQAHSDITIADSMFSAVLYVNHEHQCQGGTSLLEHIESGSQNGHQKGWQDDKNRPAAWIERLKVQMTPNRIFICPSELIHRSEPIGGFGTTAKDARVVMVALFDLVK